MACCKICSSQLPKEIFFETQSRSKYLVLGREIQVLFSSQLSSNFQNLHLPHIAPHPAAIKNNIIASKQNTGRERWESHNNCTIFIQIQGWNNSSETRYSILFCFSKDNSDTETCNVLKLFYRKNHMLWFDGLRWVGGINCWGRNRSFITMFGKLQRILRKESIKGEWFLSWTHNHTNMSQ